MTEQEYNQQIDYIFNRFPSFQKVGAGAYKPGIDGIRELVAATGNPHNNFKAIHIAGTNGKGSTSHMIAAALSRMPHTMLGTGDGAGDGSDRKMVVGLYTSPHLTDFRERIKVSGPDGFEMVSKDFVYSFINRYKPVFEQTRASFFEITTAMAFAWFSHKNVDIAVIECGLGGRLDSTNIISPDLSIITNIGLDHCDFLGSSVEAIAAEKAGIIKPGVPVIIGEESGVGKIFSDAAKEADAPIFWAEKYGSKLLQPAGLCREKLDLQGDCQDKNIKTVVAALEVWIDRACEISPDGRGWSERYGTYIGDEVGSIHNAAAITGLHGRWEKLWEEPFVVCDTGHNSHGFKILGNQIRHVYNDGSYGRLVMVFGVVADKDLDSITAYLPNGNVADDGKCSDVHYLFVNAMGTRALPAEQLKEKMLRLGFEGEVVGDGSIVGTLNHYMENMGRADDMVFIGGSTFVVAEAIPFFDSLR